MEPEYSTKDLITAFENPKVCWFFKDLKEEQHIYRGSAFAVVSAPQDMMEPEIEGRIRENEFVSVDGTYSAKVAESLQATPAVAIKCTDGVVIILKIPDQIDGKRIEGYWYSSRNPYYPTPKPNELSEIEAQEIYHLIKEKEKECEIIYTRGDSLSRIDKTLVGSNEYHHENWLWPEGFAEHYVLKYKVRPSKGFLAFLNWQANE